MKKKAKYIILFSILGLIILTGFGTCSFVVFKLFAFSDTTPLPALHSAAYRGDNKKVLKLLKHTDIDSNEYDNQTPLHWAIKGNQLETVKLLVEKGADIEANSSGYDTVTHTPLYYAASAGNNEIIDYLILSGASIEKSPDALDAAVIQGHFETVEKLLSLGWDPNFQDDVIGFTPIIHAARSLIVPGYVNGEYVKKENYVRVIEILMDNGADVSAIAEGGQSVTYFAVKANDINLLNTFIENGAPVNQKNDIDETPLSVAKELGYDDIVELLIENGAVE